MKARTERRLGFAAAIGLTAAAFVMPGVSTQFAQNDVVQAPQIHLASAENLRAELRHFVNRGDAMPKSLRR
ncbi:hypothetical protein H7Q97_01785 [Ochrobactrum sp. CM-21-5]|nr:hypothetical protein [Ochrobactrum sp. CM-21-5]MBC2884127.1 hypothetical protein [Ochrobactrum sp. CM-21-5]